MFVTKDGGQHWRKVVVDIRPLKITSIDFVNDKEGWLAGYVHKADDIARKSGEAVLYHSIDGGENWERSNLKNGEKFYSGVFFTDIQSGWVFGRDNLYRTLDSGKTWVRYELPEDSVSPNMK